MKAIYIFMLFGVFLSCNTKKEKEKQNSTQSDVNSSSVINCYQFANGSDTIELKLIYVGESITGTLVYRLKEKDKNEGTIQGVMKDSMLVADYTFMSEGIRSTRQVAFKLQDDNFIEGYGESYAENEVMKFKDPSSLTFNPSVKLSAIACQVINGQPAAN